MQPAPWPVLAAVPNSNRVQETSALVSSAGPPGIAFSAMPRMQPAVIPDAIVMQSEAGPTLQAVNAGGLANGTGHATKAVGDHHPERAVPSSFSFEGCGAAISYHLGVYGAVSEIYGKENLKSVKWVGTSSGSIAALVAALGLDAQFWKDRLQVLWGPLQDYCCGLLQVDEFVSEALDEMLETFNGHAHDHLTGRLYVSVTQFPFTNKMISTWESDQHVKDAILASCFIPATALFPVRVGPCFAIDGGFSLNNPRLDDQTVLVSPARTPHSEIRPAVKARFRDLIGAPKPERFHELWLNGIQDAEEFFEPSQVHEKRVDATSAPQQTACGKCYYWAMRQHCCMLMRISLFWTVLFLQVLCMPFCWAAFAMFCKQNLRPKPESPPNRGPGEPLTRTRKSLAALQQMQQTAQAQPDLEHGAASSALPAPTTALPAEGGAQPIMQQWPAGMRIGGVAPQLLAGQA